MHKNELRRAIIADVEANKDTYSLRELHILTDLFRRKSSETDYATLTEVEWNRVMMISTLLRMDDAGSVRRLRLVADAVQRRRANTPKTGGTDMPA